MHHFFKCLAIAMLGIASSSGRAEGFNETEVRRAFGELEQSQLEVYEDWPEMRIPETSFARIYQAWVAPAKPSPFCESLLAWLGRDAATAVMLHDVVGKLDAEENARLALAALRWASPRPSLAIVSVGVQHFPKDYRLGFLQAKLLEECGEFSKAIKAHLRLLQTQEEMPPPPDTDPATGEYATWMALRPEPVTELGGPDSPLSFWLGVNIGYHDLLTSSPERIMQRFSDREGREIEEMQYFIVPPNLESLRAACLGRLALLLRELPAATRSQVQQKLNQRLPALGPYFPMFQADAFRPNWPWLIKRLATNPGERNRIVSLAKGFTILYQRTPDIALEVANESTAVGRPTPAIFQQALTQFAQSAPGILIQENARGWSHSPISAEASFCLEFLESTPPRADLAPMLPGSFSDLDGTLPQESLALIPRIDALLEKWHQALPQLPKRLREDILTCRLECLGKLADRTQFERLAALHPNVSTYDGEKPREEVKQEPLALRIPAASKALQAAQTMTAILLPSNRYRQFDHLMTEANLRLGTRQGSWERFDCQDAEILDKLLSLRRPQTGLEMARVAEAYGLIGHEAKAIAWFDRALKSHPSHRWILYRAGANLLAHDPVRAEVLLKGFPTPAVHEACGTAGWHFNAAQHFNATALLNIATVSLNNLQKAKADNIGSALGMFYLLNAEPHEDDVISLTEPFEINSEPTAKPAPKPSIWSVAGGLTASQHKQHERLCDQFLAYFRARPQNYFGSAGTDWVGIAALIHQRRGANPSKLADDCVCFLKQYIGSNDEGPYWGAYADQENFPGPIRVVFDAWLKDPEKLREKYVNVFKKLPNTNKLPELFEHAYSLKTCDKKIFRAEAERYSKAYPLPEPKPEFIREIIRMRLLHDVDAIPSPDYPQTQNSP